MTKDDVIRFAVECQLLTTANRDGVYADALEAFAKLVAAEVKEALTEQHMNDIWQAIKIEREECAKVCDSIDKSHWGCEVKASWCSDAIRARGQA